MNEKYIPFVLPEGNSGKGNDRSTRSSGWVGEKTFEGRVMPSSPKRQSDPSVWRELGSLALKIGAIVGIAVWIFTFVYGLHYNADPAMNPAVKDGDLVIYYRWDKDYRAGDLLLLTFQGQTQVRRVIAVAGDTVDITENGLVINGALQFELGIYQKTERYAEGIDFPLTLGENEVFVLGDAREGATDSRIYGVINIKDTHGTVITVLRRRSL
jgi:signal peptidase I